MNIKRWLLGSLGVYIAAMILDNIIHGLILRECYVATANLWRPEAEMKMWITWIATAIFSLLFVYIFIKGYEGKGILEGVRYGLWMGLLIYVPMAFGTYSIMPIPCSLALSWLVLGTIEVIILGIVVAWLYKPAEAAESAPAAAPPSPEQPSE